ncbi:MAG: DUF134 domain-containing protein [Tissierellia bacterium]|nr:DUF134 domain-containing protein [Tissierellia bacterium]
MVRPIKCRRIRFFPQYTYYMPLNKDKYQLEEITLKVEELEALRLKDIEGLSQEECAKSMEVSRQTFQNIIDSARRKVAMALIQGNAIHVNGGDYTIGLCKIKCLSCQQLYIMDHEKDRPVCPFCGSKEIICHKNNRFCHRWSINRIED